MYWLLRLYMGPCVLRGGLFGCCLLWAIESSGSVYKRTFREVYKYHTEQA